ncbi:MAG: hypothetical protein ACOX6S_12980 [Clostridia bacterium]
MIKKEETIKTDSIKSSRKGTFNPIDQLELWGQLADMKEIDYRNSLAIASIIEVLLDKRIITREDIANKAAILDRIASEEQEAEKKSL